VVFLIPPISVRILWHFAWSGTKVLGSSHICTAGLVFSVVICCIYPQPLFPLSCKWSAGQTGVLDGWLPGAFLLFTYFFGRFCSALLFFLAARWFAVFWVPGAFATHFERLGNSSAVSLHWDEYIHWILKRAGSIKQTFDCTMTSALQ
jgi:hypothetical protein